MIKGKRLKHDGDALTDSRTGRTKSGEALNRALHYFDAALCFLMGGCALERDYENGNNIYFAVLCVYKLHTLEYWKRLIGYMQDTPPQIFIKTFRSISPLSSNIMVIGD